MATLVPYARMAARNPYVTRRAYLYGLRARAAARVIWRNYARARASRVFTRVKRAAAYGMIGPRKRRRFNTVGDKPGKGTTKRNEIDNRTETWDSNTQYFVTLTDLGRQATNEINFRVRDLVTIKGWKICMNYQSKLLEPLYVNVAIVACKDVTGSIIPDFFRSFGNERAVDFNDVNLTCFDRHCRPINSDKWTVMYHKRFKLGVINDTASAFSENRESYGSIMKWIKFNRQIRWDDGNPDTSADNAQVRLIWWFGTWNGTNTVTTAVANGQVRVVTYFREPR